MPNAIDSLSRLAQECYDAPAVENGIDWITAPVSGDRILDSLTTAFYFPSSAEPVVSETVHSLSGEQDLELFFEHDDRTHLMLFSSTGFGVQQNIESLTRSLVICAARRAYSLRLPASKSSFVGLVLENYEELKKAARGEPVRGYELTGLTGVKLTGDQRVETPWGTLHPAPPERSVVTFMGNVPQTTALLIRPKFVNFKITSELSPSLPMRDTSETVKAMRARQLLPLAFALATASGDQCAPLPTFETTLLPFTNGMSWSNFQSSGGGRSTGEPTDEQIIEFEVWSRRLERQYPENLHVAGRRIVSAIAERIDRADSLIDAVTAWESMVGTGTETSFRVTAALTKLIELDLAKRIEFRKDLNKTYALRSRVVHGDPIDHAAVSAAADKAIAIGLTALAAILSGPRDLLRASSGERADRLILER